MMRDLNTIKSRPTWNGWRRNVVSIFGSKKHCFSTASALL
jgi:hypothetical protein